MSSTGNIFAGTGESVDRAGLTAWTTPGNVTADDANDATCNGASGSDYLVGRNFSWPGGAIPSNATIDGILARAHCSEHSGGTEALLSQLQDNTAALVGTNKTTSNEGAISGTAKAVYTWGSVSDKWGFTPTPTILNNANFGIRFWFATSHDVRVNYITLDVTYTIGAFTQTVTGTSTNVGDIQKLSLISPIGNSLNEGILQKLTVRSLFGESLNAATLQATTENIIEQFISGLSTSQGILQKTSIRLLSGNTTSIGVVQKFVSKVLDGISNAIGNIIKKISLTQVAVSTSIGVFEGHIIGLPPAGGDPVRLRQTGYLMRRIR